MAGSFVLDCPIYIQGVPKLLVSINNASRTSENKASTSNMFLPIWLPY